MIVYDKVKNFTRNNHKLEVNFIILKFNSFSSSAVKFSSKQSSKTSHGLNSNELYRVHLFLCPEIVEKFKVLKLLLFLRPKMTVETNIFLKLVELAKYAKHMP